MFRPRVFTPPAIDGDGWPHAGAELLFGSHRVVFRIDLSYWSIADYQRQWRSGMDRLARGAPSSALMSAYRGPRGSSHAMWALWRDATHVYVQEHSVVPAELEVPFDPRAPYAFVEERLPAAEHGLPIPEWSCKLEHLNEPTWPFGQ
jgi:hypothetical protein